LLNFMLNSLEKLNIQRSKTLVFPNPPPKVLWNKPTVRKLSEIKPLEIARQLTLIEMELFQKIRPRELCEGAWMKEDRATLSPNLLKIAHRFNDVVWWLVTQVVTEKRAAKREALLNKYIDVAAHLKELNNFNSLMQFVAALGSAPLQRLVPHAFRRAAYQELRQIMDHSSNYKKYRLELDSANPPLVPYIGCFQTDLVFVEDGNKIRLSNGHIHFKKCYLVAEVIQKIQQYQQTPFNLQPVPVLQQFLQNISPLSEDECWKLSCEIKPQL